MMRAMDDAAPAVRARPAAPEPEPNVGSATILSAVLSVLDRSGLRYCMLHGFEDLRRAPRSDVDLVIDATSPRQLYRLLHRHRDEIGAELLRCRGYLIQLAGRNLDGLLVFLSLDFSREAGIGDLTFYTGPEVLGARRRVDGIWAPSVPVEFGSSLARSIAKGRLESSRARQLSRLFARDPEGCGREVARFWTGPNAELILQSAGTGAWSAVAAEVEPLRAELFRACRRRFPARVVGSSIGRLFDRAARLIRPDGLSVAVLGPDGAGKSSTTDALGGPTLLPAFDRAMCWGFIPPLHRLIGRNHGPSSDPHGLRPRSLANSILRATYWFLFSTLGYARVHLALARTHGPNVWCTKSAPYLDRSNP